MNSSDDDLPLAADILTGAEAIAAYIGVSKRAAVHLCYTGQLPAFKRTGQWNMRKSRYRRHIEEQENATLKHQE